MCSRFLVFLVYLVFSVRVNIVLVKKIESTCVWNINLKWNLVEVFFKYIINTQKWNFNTHTQL